MSVKYLVRNPGRPKYLLQHNRPHHIPPFDIRRSNMGNAGELRRAGRRQTHRLRDGLDAFKTSQHAVQNFHQYDEAAAATCLGIQRDHQLALSIEHFHIEWAPELRQYKMTINT